MAEMSEAADKAGAAKRLAESAAEEVVDVARENISRNHVAWMWGGFFAGVALGAGGGFLAARRYLEPKYQKMAEEEISEMRKHFRKKAVVREDKPDLGDLNKHIEKLDYRGEPGPVVKPPVPVAPPPPPGSPNAHVSVSGETPEDVQEHLRRNVFTEKDASEGWDYDVEKAQREGQEVYVIHKDEFGETDNNEVTLSYYAGDDVLCDSNDRIIDNQARLVGDCLDKFGHGSDDKHVVYIRNEALAVDMEVISSDRTYAEEVHGFKHEDTVQRKFKKHRE